MSKKKDWKGTESVARSAAQHERKREYDAMSPEEKKAAQRRQFVGFLKMFQGEAPIIHIDGKAPHVQGGGGLAHGMFRWRGGGYAKGKASICPI